MTPNRDMVDPRILRAAEDELNRSTPGDLTFDLRPAGRSEVHVRIYGGGTAPEPALSYFVRFPRRARPREVVRRVRAASRTLFESGYAFRAE